MSRDDIEAIELAARARVSYRQIHYWTTSGYLVTVPRDARHRMFYTPAEARIGLVIAELVHAGVELSAAGPAARTAVFHDDVAFALLLPGERIALFGRLR